MKSNGIKKYFIVNPSPNLYKLSQRLTDYGKEVELCSVEPIIKISGNRIVYKEETDYHIYSFDITTDMIPEPLLNFKKNIFSSLSTKRFLKKNRLPSHNEYLLKNRFPIVEPFIISNTTNISKLEHILSSEKNCIFLASYVTSKDISNISFNKEVASFDISFNIEKYIGSDYIIVRYEDKNVEFFINEGKLTMLADNYDIINKVINMTFLKNIDLKLIDRYKLFRNEDPFILKLKSNFILINDYSYFNISFNPGKLWYEKLGRFLCTERL